MSSKFNKPLHLKAWEDFLIAVVRKLNCWMLVPQWKILLHKVCVFLFCTVDHINECCVKIPFLNILLNCESFLRLCLTQFKRLQWKTKMEHFSFTRVWMITWERVVNVWIIHSQQIASQGHGLLHLQHTGSKQLKQSQKISFFKGHQICHVSHIFDNWSKCEEVSEWIIQAIREDKSSINQIKFLIPNTEKVKEQTATQRKSTCT